jgi:hypothetical protein
MIILFKEQSMFLLRLNVLFINIANTVAPWLIVSTACKSVAYNSSHGFHCSDKLASVYFYFLCRCLQYMFISIETR